MLFFAGYLNISPVDVEWDDGKIFLLIFIRGELMKKEEITGASIIEERRNRLVIGKELDEIGDAIKKEIKSFELQE